MWNAAPSLFEDGLRWPGAGATAKRASPSQRLCLFLLDRFNDRSIWQQHRAECFMGPALLERDQPETNWLRLESEVDKLQ